MLIHTTDKTWSNDINHKTAFVFFSAPWCGPCRVMQPWLEELSSDFPGVKICKVDISHSPEMTARSNIKSVPTLIVFQDGKQVNMREGLMKKNEIENLILSYLKLENTI